MPAEEIVTYYEMTSPDQLRPGRPAPAPVTMEAAGADVTPLLRDTWARIGGPYEWRSRLAWTDADWHGWLGRPGLRPWLAYAGSDVAGLVELEVQAGGDVEVVIFGLVPEFVGRGFGGNILTLATEHAWAANPAGVPGAVPTRRVWLHTSSRDHVNARSNYERRGFRAYRTEVRQRESS